MEKLIIAVAGFPVIYDVPQTQQFDHPLWCEFDKKARNTIFRGHFPARMLFFSGNSIHLLKTIPRLVNVSYNVEIRLALKHEHKSTPYKWLLIGLFS